MDPNIVFTYDRETEFVKKEHICLNNFEHSPFIDEKGNHYFSAENYYQCHKFDNFDDGEEFKKAFKAVLDCKDADTCKKIARKLTKEDLNGKWQEKKWEEEMYKVTIMKRALMLKYSQNLNMLKILLETGNKKVVERSERDSFWGGYLEGSKNVLGNLLMELRDNYNKTKLIFLEGSGFEPIKNIVIK